MEYKKLEEFLNYIQPTNYIVKSENYSMDYDVPVLTAGQTFLLGYTNEKNGIYNASKYNPIILFDDFTTAFKWVDFPFKVKSSACKILIPKKNQNIRYVFYAMQKVKIDNSLHKRYWISLFSQKEIKNPSLDKQQEIVSILDKINAIIDADKKQLELLDETVKSRFVEMFENQDFPRYKLCDITYKITDGKHGGCNTVNSSDFYFVGAREIYDNKINYKTAQFITESEFIKDYKRCNLEIGDFIIVNTGATIGKNAIVSDSRATRTLLQKSVAMIKPNKKVLLPIYLKYIYDCHKELYIVDNSSAQPNLLLSKIKATEISVPPIELQNEFASFVKQIDESKFNIQQHLNLMQELLDKKMDEYFGE